MSGTDPADQVTGAQSLVQSLEQVGAEVVFGIPGGAILPAYDPLFDSEKVRHILVRHEQGAGHAAEGYAMVTGKVGVCMATPARGDQPGDADRGPHMLGADGCPHRAVAGAGPGRRFQEADIRGIRPITAHLPGHPDDIAVASLGLPHRRHRSARSGAGRHPKDSLQREPVRMAREPRPAR